MLIGMPVRIIVYECMTLDKIFMNQTASENFVNPSFTCSWISFVKISEPYAGVDFTVLLRKKL